MSRATRNGLPHVEIVMPLGEQRGGAELLLLHFLRANQKRPRVTCGVTFLEDGPMVEDVAALGYPARVLPAGQLRQVGKTLSCVRQLANVFRRERPAAVVGWMAKAHLYGGPAARMAGVPAVWWQLGLPDGHWMDKAATLLPAAGIFCCSRATEVAQRAVKPVRPTRVVHLAVDMDRWDLDQLPSPEEARTQLGLRQEIPIVGIVARLQQWKGVHVFVEAASRLAQENPDALFLVVGGEHSLEPEYATQLRAQIAETGLQQRIRMVGHQEQPELWMQAMDVVVHASTGPEPFGMVIVEALALGKRILAADAAGPQEILEGAGPEIGQLVTPGSAKDLVHAIRDSLAAETADPALRAGRIAARREWAERFSADRFTERMIADLLNHFVSGTPGPSPSLMDEAPARSH